MCLILSVQNDCIQYYTCKAHEIVFNKLHRSIHVQLYSTVSRFPPLLINYQLSVQLLNPLHLDEQHQYEFKSSQRHGCCPGIMAYTHWSPLQYKTTEPRFPALHSQSDILTGLINEHRLIWEIADPLLDGEIYCPSSIVPRDSPFIGCK